MVLNKNFACNLFCNIAWGLQLDKKIGRSNTEETFAFELLHLIWFIDQNETAKIQIQKTPRNISLCQRTGYSLV